MSVGRFAWRIKRRERGFQISRNLDLLVPKLRLGMRFFRNSASGSVIAAHLSDITSVADDEHRLCDPGGREAERREWHSQAELGNELRGPRLD